jgi:uncharacterized protein YbaR (Trm112 family)/SAM-dependent methyltransferase
MRHSLVHLLCCPFCGDGLQVDAGACLAEDGDEVRHGILFCQCCAYPVVDGIPYLRAGSLARKALQLLKEQQPSAARFCLLGLDEPRVAQFQRQSTSGPMTFSRALRLLSPTDEGCYFLYRFSDPTYLVSETILRTLDSRLGEDAGTVLDLGGGTGHFSRCLHGLNCARDVVLADLEFWKLWLAREFVAPACQAVCCDANAPLPFARRRFSLAFCSDAMNYIWQRRLAVSELCRLLTDRGAVLVTHMHNALCANPSAGMPLTPAGYHALFETLPVRLFPESPVLDAALEQAPLDLASAVSPAALAAEPSLFALATQRLDLFRKYPQVAAPRPGPLRMNPLYRLAQTGPPQIWRRQFPSAAYEAEYAAAKRYLPERFELSTAQVHHLETGRPDASLDDLVFRRVLLALPERYASTALL